MLGWVLGLVFAVVFALLAYLYYYVAIVLAMGAFGFAIGSGLVVALGIDWNWVAVLVGLVVGVILGLVSIFANMPMIVLVVFSSIAGAVAVVGGVMLLVGSLNSADFTRGDFTDTVDNGWAWSLLLLVLALRRDPHPGQPAGCDAPHHPRNLVRRDSLIRRRSSGSLPQPAC